MVSRIDQTSGVTELWLASFTFGQRGYGHEIQRE